MSEGPLPLSPAELDQLEGEPVYIVGGSNVGVWDIFAHADDGSWIFVMTELTKGQLINDTLAQAIKDGVMHAYGRMARIELKQKQEERSNV